MFVFVAVVLAINIMSPKSKKKYRLSLLPFRSPRSEELTLQRQDDRVIAGRMDWGTPIGPRSDGSAIWQYTLDFAAAESDTPYQNQNQNQEIENSSCVGFNPLTKSRDIRIPVYRCPSETMAANIGALSPSSSPRLPSPPPFPEVQIGPRSPTTNASSNMPSPGRPNPGNTSPGLTDPTSLDDGATRRIRPGTKAVDMESGPPLVPLAEVGFI